MFTVIIATCGRPQQLRLTLECVIRAAEMIGGCPVIVVDNHPEYAAETACGRTEAGSHPVTYLRSEPFNKARALNSGIAKARTRWLAFTDDDTLPDRNWLARSRRHAQESGCRVFAGRIVAADPAGRLPRWMRPGKSGLVPAGGAIVAYDPPAVEGCIGPDDPVPFGANVFVRRDVFEAFGGYDEALWRMCGWTALGVEDAEFGVRLRNAGERIGYARDAVVVHPCHAARIALGRQMRNAYAYGWRDPFVLYDPERGVRPFHFRLMGRRMTGAVRCLFRRDPAGVAWNMVETARTAGYIAGLSSRRYKSFRSAARKPPPAIVFRQQSETEGVSGSAATRQVAPWPELACPKCGTGFSPSAPASDGEGTESDFTGRHGKGAGWVCRGCGFSARNVNGVADCSTTGEFYWGELPRETMGKLLDSAGPVMEAFERVLPTLPREIAAYLRRTASDSGRAGWKFLTGLPEGGTALDMGCGLGAVSMALAEQMRVWAVDVVMERVAFTVRRANDANTPGQVRGCAASGWPRLPFPDGVFDLVVLNGVLEWVPSSVKGDPAVVQRVVLSEVARVLRPGGQVYIGIENRFSVFYFAGRPEEHTKMRWLPLLPRPVAGAYHRWVKKTEFVNYTHGSRGLRRLLADVGMPDARFFFPYPNYREFDRIADLRDPSWFDESFTPRSVAGRVARSVMKCIPAARNFVPSFGVVAGQVAVPSFVERLGMDLADRGLLRGNSTVGSYRVTATGCCQVLFLPDRKLATLPLDTTAKGRVLRSVERRARLGALSLPPGLPAQLRNCVLLRHEGLPVKVEPFVDGRRGWTDEDDAAQSIERSLAWLGELHLASLRLSSADRFSPSLIENQGEGDVATRLVRENITPATWIAWDARMRSLASAPVRVCAVHGDFRRQNILFGPANSVIAVVDWDLSETDGLPFWDILSLFHNEEFDRSGTWTAAYGRTVQTCASGNRSVEEYGRRLGLEPRDFWLAALSFPLLHLRNTMLYGNKQSRVLLEGLEPAIRNVLSAVAGAER